MLGRQADYRLPRENLTTAVREKAAYYGADEALTRTVVYDFLNEDIKVQNLPTDRDYDIWWFTETPTPLSTVDDEDQGETYFHSVSHSFTVAESLEYLVTQYIILILVTIFTVVYATTKLNRCLRTRR